MAVTPGSAVLSATIPAPGNEEASVAPLASTLSTALSSREAASALLGLDVLQAPVIDQTPLTTIGAASPPPELPVTRPIELEAGGGGGKAAALQHDAGTSQLPANAAVQTLVIGLGALAAAVALIWLRRRHHLKLHRKTASSSLLGEAGDEVDTGGRDLTLADGSPRMASGVTPPDRALAAILDRIKARKEEEEARAAGLVRAKARANVVVSGMADVKTSCNGASSSAGAVDNAVFVGDWLPPPDRTSPLLGAGLGGGGVGSKAGGGSGGGARCGGGRGGGSGGSAGCSVRGGGSAGGGDVGGGGTVAADGVGDDRRAALRTHKPTHRSAPVRKQQEREPSPVRQHRTAPMLQVLMTPRDRLTGSDEEARRERERFLQNQHTGWR